MQDKLINIIKMTTMSSSVQLYSAVFNKSYVEALEPQKVATVKTVPKRGDRSSPIIVEFEVNM